jgi:hypothetical protein
MYLRKAVKKSSKLRLKVLINGIKSNVNKNK